MSKTPVFPPTISSYFMLCPMPLGFIGKHINKIKHISCSPIFQSCLYYAMQSVMLVCQHKGVSRKKAEMFSWLIHAAQYCSMYLVTNTLYSLLPWIEGVTAFFYSPSIHGGRLLAPFTRMQHLLLCLLTSSPPPSPHAQTVTHRACMFSHARVEKWMGWPFLHAWHPKRSPRNARKLNCLLVLVLEELRLLFRDSGSISCDFYLSN